MMILITYDVDFSDKKGAVRLRKVAKICSDYGVRVQNSVFEMLINNMQLEEIKQKLRSVIDVDHDSVRFYRIGKNRCGKVDTLGKSAPIEQGESLIL